MSVFCNDDLQTIINAFMTGCYVISTCAFLITSIVHLMNRRAYHPIFSFLFLLLLAVYVFSNSLNVAEFVIVHLVTVSDGLPFYLVGRVHQALYTYLTCTVAMCVFERCFATIFMHTYEHWRPWNAVLGAQIIAGIVIYIKLDLMERDHLLEEILQFAISMIIIVMLVFLLYMNVRLTQLLQGGNGRLSTRYQLIENIKILRLLVPVVVFDTTVCAVDLIGAVFFNIQPAFNKIDCSNSAFYLPAYFVFRLISISMEWFIPISIIYQQPTPVHFNICLRKMRIKCCFNVAPKKIRNVLGTEIQASSHQVNYFDQLQKQWSSSVPSKS